MGNIMNKWLNIKNVQNIGKKKTADIWIDGVIGYKDWFDDSGTVASEFIRTMEALGKLDEINVSINSPGGVVSDGITIANFLRNHEASVSMTVMGQAASIASVIVQAADPGKLHMALGSTMMIHDPWTIVAGNSEDMRKIADDLDKLRDSILSFYQIRTDLAGSDIKDLMSDETIMTAEDAVEWGFADTMDAELKAVAVANPKIAIMAAQKEFQKRLNHEPLNEGGHDMPTKDPVKPEITATYLVDNHASVVAEMSESARKEGAEAECKRVQDVFAQTLPGHENLIQSLAFDGKTTGPEAAVAILKAEKSARADMAQKLKDDAPDPLQEPLDSGDGAEAGTAAQFDAEVAALIDDGKSRGQAISAVAQSNPEAHAAWVKSKNGGKQS